MNNNEQILILNMPLEEFKERTKENEKKIKSIVGDSTIDDLTEEQTISVISCIRNVLEDAGHVREFFPGWRKEEVL